MVAESVALAEYIKSYLSDIITATEESEVPLNIVERVYDFTDDLGSFEGRRIRIFPMDYVRNEPITRREDSYDVRVGIIVSRRYTNPSNPTKAAPVAWIDAEVEFVETYVFSPLASPRIMHLVPMGAETVQYWSQEAQNNIVYDYIKLSQHKTFWTELEFVFRKVRPD